MFDLFETRLAATLHVALRVKQLQALLDKGKQFGIMSGERPGSKSQQKKQHSELLQDLQKKGFKKLETLRAEPWKEGGRRETSVLIRDIKPDELFALGEEFAQDAIIYKSPDGVVAMYHQKAKKVTFAMRPDKEIAVETSADKSLYSKARGLSFSFGFLWGEELPWDGKTVVTKKDIEAVAAGRPPKHLQPHKDDEKTPKPSKKDDEKASGSKTKAVFLEEHGNKEVPNPDFDTSKPESKGNPRRRKIQNLPWQGDGSGEYQKDYFHEWRRTASTARTTRIACAVATRWQTD